MKNIILASAVALMTAGSASAWSVNTPGFLSQAPSFGGKVVTKGAIASFVASAFVVAGVAYMADKGLSCFDGRRDCGE